MGRDLAQLPGVVLLAGECEMVPIAGQAGACPPSGAELSAYPSGICLVIHPQQGRSMVNRALGSSLPMPDS